MSRCCTASGCCQRLQFSLQLPTLNYLRVTPTLLDCVIVSLPLSIGTDIPKNKSGIHRLRALEIDHHHAPSLGVAENIGKSYISVADAKCMCLIHTAINFATEWCDVVCVHVPRDGRPLKAKQHRARQYCSTFVQIHLWELRVSIAALDMSKSVVHGSPMLIC